VGFVLAAELKGKVKSVNADANTVTVEVDGKEIKLDIGPDTKLVNQKDKALKDGLKSLKPGANVVITCEKKDGKEVCTQLKVAGKKDNK
jgi:Cu/Ag efflux protein CusF